MQIYMCTCVEHAKLMAGSKEHARCRHDSMTGGVLLVVKQLSSVQTMAAHFCHLYLTLGAHAQ